MKHLYVGLREKLQVCPDSNPFLNESSKPLATSHINGPHDQQRPVTQQPKQVQRTTFGYQKWKYFVFHRKLCALTLSICQD